ncbi:MAG: cysteine desulfurase family protein [Acidimicrobiales bacterium]
MTTTAYLDHAATSPLRPAAAAAMEPYLSGLVANPSSAHPPGRRAQAALDGAREVIAGALGCRPIEVVFTSGGTEADNLAIKGACRALGGYPVCCSTEHEAVLAPTRSCSGAVVPVCKHGLVGLAELEAVLAGQGPAAGARGPGPAVVSVMLANNETGVVQPLSEVVALVREVAPGALVHTDAVAAMEWLDVSRLAGEVDLLSVSGHKAGAPVGCGVLVVRDRHRLAPVIEGGGQELGLRSGTPPVALAVAMAAAMDEAVAGRREAVARAAALRDRLAAGLMSAVAGCWETVPDTSGARPPSPSSPPVPSARIASNCHLAFDGVESEELLWLMGERGVFASAGSACSSGAMEPSHVLLAMGIDPDVARSCVRFTLGPTTTDEEIDLALEVVPAAVARLRGEAA